MADKTKIGWTDATWNVVTGCSKISTGCKNCYAAMLAPRLAKMGAKGYTELPWTASNSAENVTLHPERLEQPLKKTKTSMRFFTCSMSDLFHDRVPDDFLDKVFAVMALAGWHTFQVLTKRAERMRDYMTSPVRHGRVDQEAFEISRDELGTDPDARNWSTIHWPLENVWLGTSVEDQCAADERIPYLLETPAAIRFLSCEPLLGPVDIDKAMYGSGPRAGMNAFGFTDGLGYEAFIQWVIAGGESGSSRRPMQTEWARKLREDCAAAGVPFFFKQHSAYRPESDIHLDGEIIRQFPGDDL